MQARQKPLVDQFSEKALVDFQPYQSVDGFSNPILLKTTSGHKTISDEPKRLMTRFPTKQGQHFSLNLGQNEGPFKQSGLNG